MEKLKPVDLEPDDPDRESGFMVECPVCKKNKFKQKFKEKNTCREHIWVSVCFDLEDR